MTHWLSLRAKWPARPQSLESCTDDAMRYFALLAPIDPRFARWFKKGRSKKQAMEHEVDVTDAPTIRRILQEKRDREDVDRGIIEQLGFDLFLWNGQEDEDETCSIRISIGISSRIVRNVVDLSFPRAMNIEPVKHAELYRRVLDATAAVFRPPSAGVVDRRASDFRPIHRDRPFLDWMLYVPDHVAAVPSPARLYPATGGGTIIVSQPTPPLPDDEIARAHLLAIERAIGLPPIEAYAR